MKIIDRIVSKVKIIEATSQSKLPNGVLCRITYPICNIGERNHNNRKYRKEVWESVHSNKDLVEKIGTRTLFGHAEHPKDETQSNLEKTSHIVTKLYMNESTGKEYAEVDVLDTPYGRIVNTLLQAGCQVGMSTRAEGELKESEDESGKFMDVIPESYKFVTVDFTADPSTLGAYPQKVEFNVVGQLQSGLESKKIEREFATCLLESMQTKEAKTLLEKVKKTGGCKTDHSVCVECQACKKVKENKYHVIAKDKDGKVVKDLSVYASSEQDALGDAGFGSGDNLQYKVKDDKQAVESTGDAPSESFDNLQKELDGLLALVKNLHGKERIDALTKIAAMIAKISGANENAVGDAEVVARTIWKKSFGELSKDQSDSIMMYLKSLDASNGKGDKNESVEEALSDDDKEVGKLSKQYGFGSVAWQDAMIDRIKNKVKNGIALSGTDTAFIETQNDHDLQLEIEELEKMYKAPSKPGVEEASKKIGESSSGFEDLNDMLNATVYGNYYQDSKLLNALDAFESNEENDFEERKKAAKKVDEVLGEKSADFDKMTEDQFNKFIDWMHDGGVYADMPKDLKGIVKESSKKGVNIPEASIGDAARMAQNLWGKGFDELTSEQQDHIRQQIKKTEESRSFSVKMAERTAEFETLSRCYEDLEKSLESVRENYSNDIMSYMGDINEANEKIATVEASKSKVIEKAIVSTKAAVDVIIAERDATIASLRAEISNYSDKNSSQIDEMSIKNDVIKEMKNSHISEVESLVAENKKKIDELNAVTEARIAEAVVKTYANTIIKMSGLSLPESAKRVVMESKTEAEVDQTLNRYRDAIREGSVHYIDPKGPHSGRIGEVIVESKVDPIEDGISSRIGSALDAMGKKKIV